MMSMNRGISIIGIVVVSVLLGGTVVYGSQNNAVALSNNSSLAGVLIPKAVFADASVAISPRAATGIASDMTSSTAAFHGVIYPHRAEISYWFEYSADPLLGLILIRRTPRVSLVTDSKQRSVEVDVTGLMKSTKYYFRIVTKDGSDTMRTVPASFNTK